jgi:hypothetical protein
MTTATLNPGTLSVLNVGAGDLKFSFDPAKPGEVEKAKRTVEDMLRRGYTLLVEVVGVLHKAKGFDPARCEYVIVDEPDEPAAVGTAIDADAAVIPAAKKRGRPRSIPASAAKATAIAPTAGG